MAILNFTDGTENLSDIEQTYIKCKLAGVGKDEINSILGHDYFKLNGDEKLNDLILKIKAEQKLKTFDVKELHISEYIKLVPNAIKLANNGMAGKELSKTQLALVRMILGPANAYLRRAAENNADKNAGIDPATRPNLVVDVSGTE